MEALLAAAQVIRMTSGEPVKPPSPCKSSISIAMVHGPAFISAAGMRYLRAVPMSEMVLAIGFPFTNRTSASSMEPSSMKHSFPSHSAGISIVRRYHSMPSIFLRAGSAFQRKGSVTGFHSLASSGASLEYHFPFAPGSVALIALHHAVPAS